MRSSIYKIVEGKTLTQFIMGKQLHYGKISHSLLDAQSMRNHSGAIARNIVHLHIWRRQIHVYSFLFHNYHKVNMTELYLYASCHLGQKVLTGWTPIHWSARLQSSIQCGIHFKFQYYFLWTSLRSESFMRYAFRKLHQLISVCCAAQSKENYKNWLPQFKRSHLFIHFLCCSMQSWSLEIHDKWTSRLSLDLIPWLARGFLFDITTCGYIVIIGIMITALRNRVIKTFLAIIVLMRMITAGYFLHRFLLSFCFHVTSAYKHSKFCSFTSGRLLIIMVTWVFMLSLFRSV